MSETVSEIHPEIVARAQAAGQDPAPRQLAESVLWGRVLFRGEQLDLDTGMDDLDQLRDYELHVLHVLDGDGFPWAGLLAAARALGPKGE